MSSIGGIGGFNPLAMIGQQSKDNAKDGSSSFSLANVGSPAPASEKPRYDTRAEESYEEAFAKLRVNMQTRFEGFLSDESESRQAELADSGDDVVQQFMDYMDMSTAEKLRDSMLKELGLTEEELEAMPPEQQKAVEEQLADLIKQRSELQAAQGMNGQDADEEQPSLLS
ncbi:MAG: hypothetical protein VCA57_07050 [Pseudomonas sp.]|uniref:hypothetical protein n=1 Tax=Pseudomonas sp. TaxID=306 RepID=UPI00398215CC